MKSKKLQDNVRQIAGQIIKLAHPLRIVLFGSAVDGRVTPDSDLDFLIVVPEAEHPDDVLDMLYTGVRRKPMPCDFLVVTPSVLRKNGNNPAMIYRDILERGKEIYAA